MRGRTNSDIRRLTATTMTSGSAASAIGGPVVARPAMDRFRRIERARGRRALAHDKILGRVRFAERRAP